MQTADFKIVLSSNWKSIIFIIWKTSSSFILEIISLLYGTDINNKTRKSQSKIIYVTMIHNS